MKTKKLKIEKLENRNLLTTSFGFVNPAPLAFQPGATVEAGNVGDVINAEGRAFVQDGIDDAIIKYNTPDGQQAVYVIPGGSPTLPAVVRGTHVEVELQPFSAGSGRNLPFSLDVLSPVFDLDVDGLPDTISVDGDNGVMVVFGKAAEPKEFHLRHFKPIGVSDLNGDGYDDAAVAIHPGVRAAEVRIYYGTSEGLTSEYEVVDFSSAAPEDWVIGSIEVAVADIADHLPVEPPFFVVHLQDPEDDGILYSEPGVFGPNEVRRVAHGGNSGEYTIHDGSDFNGDGAEDRFVNVGNESVSQWVVEYGTPPEPFAPASVVKAFGTSDLNDDGYDDAVVVFFVQEFHADSREVRIYYGTENGLTSEYSKVNLPGELQEVSPGFTTVGPNAEAWNTNPVSFYLSTDNDGLGDQAVTGPNQMQPYRQPNLDGLARYDGSDFNGDGVQDEIVINAGLAEVIYGKADNQVRLNADFLGLYDQVEPVGDLNGDGYDDVVARWSLISIGESSIDLYYGSPEGLAQQSLKQMQFPITYAPTVPHLVSVGPSDFYGKVTVTLPIRDEEWNVEPIQYLWDTNEGSIELAQDYVPVSPETGSDFDGNGFEDKLFWKPIPTEELFASTRPRTEYVAGIDYLFSIRNIPNALTIDCKDATPVGDVNHDGFDDLATVDHANNVEVLFGGRDGLTGESVRFEIQGHAAEGTVLDARVSPGFVHDNFVSVDLLVSYGNGTWKEFDYFWSPKTTVNNATSEFQEPDYHDRDGAVGVFTEFKLYNGSDFNGDDVSDLVKTNSDGEVQVVYRRNSDRTDRLG